MPPAFRQGTLRLAPLLKIMSISPFRPSSPAGHVSRTAAPQPSPGPATVAEAGSAVTLHGLVQADMPGGAPVTPAELRAAAHLIAGGQPTRPVVLPPRDRLPPQVELTATVLTLAFLPEIIHAQTQGQE